MLVDGGGVAIDVTVESGEPAGTDELFETPSAATESAFAAPSGAKPSTELDGPQPDTERVKTKAVRTVNLDRISFRGSPPR
jgi:hypothetical protein